MKSLKSLALTVALVGAYAGSVFANTTSYVEIVGAPAFRQDSNANIAAYVASLGGTITATSGPTTSVSDVKSASANQWLIPNFSTGVDLEIDASYTGSTAGFEATASGTVTSPWGQKFITHNTGSAASPVTGASTSTAYVANFTLSDTFQATTPFNGTKTYYGGASNTLPFTASYAALTNNQLGIEPYHFVASPGATAAGLTNITTSQAQALFKIGQLPLAFFTGNNADEGKWVYGLTRDGGSGARLVAQAETGIGLNSTLVTYQPTISGGTVDSSGNQVNGTEISLSGTETFDAINQVPAGKTPSTGIWAVQGNGGYAKFGTPSGQNGLLLAITSTPLSGAYFITYLNNSDDAEAVAAGASELTYNGVAYSLGAVQEGKYSFWSYEGLFAPSSISGNAATVASYLEANWVSTAPLAGVNVQRTADGGIISGTYY